MSTSQRVWQWMKQAAHEHWLAFLILFFPINWVVYMSEADSVLPYLILPVIGFLVGYLLRPPHVWLLWLASVVLVWVADGYMGKYSDPERVESVRSIMAAAFAFMLLGVLIPVWIGRFAQARIKRNR